MHVPYPGFSKPFRSKEKAMRVCRRENEYAKRACKVMPVGENVPQYVLGYCVMTPKDRKYQKLGDFGQKRWGK